MIRFVVGYILGNKTARKWCIDKFCEASVLLDKELKKTPIAELFKEKEKTENEIRRDCEKTRS